TENVSRFVGAHRMLLDAPERVVDALVRYVVDGDRDGSVLVGSYIEKNSHRIRAVRSGRGRIKSRGRVHDLERILAEVSERVLGSEAPPDVLITWGKHS